MKKIKPVSVNCPGGKYSIWIGSSLLAKTGVLLREIVPSGTKVLIVTNRKVAGLFLKPVTRALSHAGYPVFSALLPFGDERDKSIKVLEGLWTKMAEIPLERTSVVIALGGGVTGDVAGFAASTYMRGIPVIQMPTTLLSQVDSAIGGKTAVNLPAAKNIAGTFYQPAAVIADVETLKSLPLLQISHQFAEVIKYGVIQDAELFRLLEKKSASFFSAMQAKKTGPREMDFLQEVIVRSARVKAGVVSLDERETKGLRMILNYGHTFGHGFESASGYRMSHGNAVALGMLCAGRLAVKLGLWTKDMEERQKALIQLLPGLKGLKSFSLKSRNILFSMIRDKKKQNGRLRFVLPVDFGRVVVRNDIPPGLVQEVIKEISA